MTETRSVHGPRAESAAIATLLMGDKLPSIGQGRSDNLPKQNRIKSAFRDAQFMRDLQESREHCTQAGQADRLFSTTSASLNSTVSQSEHPSAKLTDTEILADLEPLGTAADSHPKRPYRIKKRSPWYLREFKSPPWANDPEWRRKRYVPAPWRDTTDILKVTYYHRALAEMSSPVGFTLRLNDDVQRLARQQPDPLNWLQERIKRNLTKVFGWSPAFYVVLEETDDMRPKLHIHGELALPHDLVCDKRFLANTKKALRAAGGQWPKGTQFQANLRLDADEGWTSYIAKTFWKWMPHTRRLLERFPNRIGPTFKICRPMSVTTDLLHRARASYEADRAAIRKKGTSQ
jgi:hypothetical protein